jgi:hypothetical protein
VRMPKMSFKAGAFASFICFVLAFAVWPVVYDQFGRGAELTRATVSASAKARGICAEVKTFFIVPWSISIEDYESAGNLSVRYWFGCDGRVGSVRARMHHLGGDWIVDSLVIDVKSQRYELVAH